MPPQFDRRRRIDPAFSHEVSLRGRPVVPVEVAERRRGWCRASARAVDSVMCAGCPLVLQPRRKADTLR